MENRGSPERYVRIPVHPMSHQREIWKKDEDWAGITSTDERRKLQNRLNQRAYRRRKLSMKNKGASIGPQNTATLDVVKVVPEPIQCENLQDLDVVALKLNLVRQYSEQAYARYLGHDTRPENLLRVVQINLFNALAGNSFMLGLSTAWLLCHSVSPFGQCGPSPNKATISTLLDTCPESLRPTALQASIPHHPWIDLLPWPELRDTILTLADKELIDEDDLCYDIVELDMSASPSDKAALIVWGEPWDPRGWEASTAFLRKWGWILQGCPEILEATNYWRDKRGEKKLILPLAQRRWNMATDKVEDDVVKIQGGIEQSEPKPREDCSNKGEESD